MTKARLVPVILALVVVFAPVTPAGAHSCSNPTTEKVGVALTLNLGVPAEAKAVVGVDVEAPRGFDLDEADADQGWTTERDGRKVRFRGGTVPPYGCTYFILRGTPTRKGKLVFPLVTRHEDGSSTDYKSDKIGDPLGAQLIFVSTSPEPSDYFDGGSDGGGGGDGIVGPAIGVGVVGLVIGGALALVQRQKAAAAKRRPTRRRRR